MTGSLRLAEFRWRSSGDSIHNYRQLAQLVDMPHRLPMCHAGFLAAIASIIFLRFDRRNREQRAGWATTSSQVLPFPDKVALIGCPPALPPPGEVPIVSKSSPARLTTVRKRCQKQRRFSARPRIQMVRRHSWQESWPNGCVRQPRHADPADPKNIRCKLPVLIADTVPMCPAKEVDALRRKCDRRDVRWHKPRRGVATSPRARGSSSKL